MAELWDLVRDPAMRDALGWLGGGLAVVCGGLWTVAIFFWKPGDPDGKGTPSPLIDASSTTTTTTVVTRGLAGWPLVALVGAVVGAMVLAASQAGDRATAGDNGAAVTGDVAGDVTVGR